MIARKLCPVCGKTLSAAAFNDSAQTDDGLARNCRACTNARRRLRDRSRKHQREPAGQPAQLAQALRQGDIDAVRKLVRRGAKPRWDWICETMRGGHLKLAEVLLKSGAVILPAGCAVILPAGCAERNVFTLAAMGDVAGLKRRLRRTPAEARRTASMQPNSLDVTPLHVGCASDWRSHGPGRLAAQVQVAEMLVDHGADVHAAARYRGLDDATPLFCACWSSGNLLLVRWLLDQGALAVDRDLGAALGHFQRHRKVAHDIAEALLAWGLSVDGSVPGDRTLLQTCAHMGVHQTVAWLIAHGADVNARAQGGRMAAHFAAERNTGPKTLALLVESGADLAARDEDGRTPLDIARLNGKARLVEWIKRRLRAKSR
jgi:ankyrin repeat protein